MVDSIERGTEVQQHKRGYMTVVRGSNEVVVD
jgi:hypothetical protein